MDAELIDRAWTTKIVILTDLHMVPDGGKIIGIDPFVRLQSAISVINRHHADAALVIVLGDLVDGGDEISYRRLQPLIEQLKPPYALMIGNHDHRPTFLSVFPQASNSFGGFVQAAFRFPGYTALLLDSVPDQPHALADDSCGYLCERRLAWLDAMLHASKDDRVMLMLHHPPMLTGFRHMDAQRLANSAELLALLRKHGNVHHIFAGHVHRTINGSWHGIPFSIFKSPVHQQPMDLRSDLSTSVDEPGAIGIVLLTKSGVIVHTDDYELSLLGDV